MGQVTDRARGIGFENSGSMPATLGDPDGVRYDSKRCILHGARVDTPTRFTWTGGWGTFLCIGTRDETKVILEVHDGYLQIDTVRVEGRVVPYSLAPPD